MCRICDGWQERNQPNASPNDETPRTPSTVGAAGTVVAHNPNSYVFLESHWNNPSGRTFTWSNATLRLDRLQGGFEYALNETQLGVVRQAFAMWAAAADVHFREVDDSDASDFRVGLGAIDGHRGTAGQAQSFTQDGFRVRSNILFDIADYPRSGSVNLRVALHEIGHALGLGHSPVADSIMYAFGNSRTTLHPDDIAGVQALFGPSRRPLPHWPASETVDLGNLTNLTAVRTQSGSVNRPNDEIDHFRFTLGDTRTIAFELRSLSGDAHLYLNDASGRYLAASYNAGNSVDSFTRELGAGTYYVSVLTTYSQRGTSNYQLRVATPGQPAGGTRETAVNLGDLTSSIPPRFRSGSVNYAGTFQLAPNPTDFYRFTLSESRTMRFELRGLSANADLRLESSSGGWLGSSYRSGTAVDAIVRTLGAGTYYIVADARDRGTIRYRLRYGVQTRPDGWTRETAWNIGNLTNVTTPRFRAGTVDGSNRTDYRRFTLSATRTMRFELRGLSANADLRLESSSRGWLGSSSRPGMSVDAIVRTLEAGTYYIRVDARDGGTIRYRLRYGVQSTPDGWTRETAWNIGNLTNVTTARVGAGTVDGSNRTDYRRFTLSATRTMRFELRGLSANADLRLESSSRGWLGSSSRPGMSVDAIVRTLEAGTYYIRVDARDSGTIRYRLRYGVQSRPDGWTRETAWNLGNLTNVSTARWRAGTVDGSNTSDYHRFTLGAARTMRFELRGLSADADLRLESSSGGWLGGSSLPDTAVDAIVRTLEAGTYYIRVDARDSGTIRYRLRYAVQSRPDGWTRETAWNLGNLTNVTPSRVRAGTVDASNTTDYHRFTLSAARTMRFELRGLSANADLRLESSNGGWLGSSHQPGVSADSIVRALDAGTYYIRVDARDSGTIGYRLRYSLDSATTLDAAARSVWRDAAVAGGCALQPHEQRLLVHPGGILSA